MNWCRDCKYAEWKLTKLGRRNANQPGRCTYEVKLPTLPASRWWLLGTPSLAGGYIEWREPKQKCPTFQPIQN